VPEGARFVIPDLQRIGKYDVLERIADGGFATLYRGRDPFLKRLVAIKVCASEDPELRQQFLREAEIAGNLDHPSIVRTFDFGFDPVGPYLVQEYLQGEDLSQLIAQRVALPTRRRLDLLIQIAEGLAYSHQRLVLHLDIKPGNVRVLGRRLAKILDFGIARLATGEAPPAGSMVGTAGYLPPEQVMSRAVDVRSDVFSFGALAYELLTFARPFAGGTLSDLLKRVLASEAEPMTRHWPECDTALADLIGRCLRRDPAARYPSFEVLLPDLQAIRDRFPEVPGGEPAQPSASSQSPVALPPGSECEHGGDDTPEAAIAEPPATKPANAGRRRWKRAAMAGLAAAVVVVAIGIAVLAASHGPATMVEAAVPQPLVPEAPGAPAPGLLVVTAAPWGRVLHVRGTEGEAIDLPADRVTPLRVWVAPGPHTVEIALAGGGSATCEVEVATGATQVCAAEPIDVATRPDGDDYFKEMGWWR
jgi:serine/threonine-protein kinase